MAAASVGLPLLVSSRVFGANDTIRVGVLGLGSRGVDFHIPCMEEQEGVKVVALCDPDRSRLGAAAKRFSEKYHHAPDEFIDLRKLLERKDIDVVAHATQTYWHALGTIWSCQAGKHVYVEKPASHYLWEGRQMVNAAQKYHRIVQCGTQERSIPGTKEAIEWVRAGNLGKVKLITAFCNKKRFSVGKRDKPLEIPPDVEYDLWCGPAKKLPLYRDKLHYDCCFDWNTGEGDSTTQGAHQMDVARWFLGEKELPRRVMSIGGRFVFNDAADCPNSQIIYYDFPSMPVLYEMHDLCVEKGSGQILQVPRRDGGRGGGLRRRLRPAAPRGKIYDTQGKLVKVFDDADDKRHFENFIAAVRSGRREDLHCEIREGHISTALCNAGSISLRVGQKVPTSEIRKVTREIPAWDEMFDRFLTHLKANGVAVDGPSLTLGPWLEPIAGQERFQNNEEANTFARGWSRAPFTVPDLSV